MAYSYANILVADIGDGVFNVQFNRPKQLNAITMDLWREIGEVFTKLDTDDNCRAIILSGSGRAFTSGIDLRGFSTMLSAEINADRDAARKGRALLRLAEKMQAAFSSIEKCCKPVVAAIHAYCLGTEVAVGLATDVGTLNRLPKIVGNHSWVREACLTGLHFRGDEALQYGTSTMSLITNRAFFMDMQETATAIATSSPVAVQGTKIVLNYARDHSVDDSLKFVAMWNMSQLQTDDIAESAVAVMTKGPKPLYAKL
ncbi:hypothetical protein PFISCL1PPCAC_17888 [Pristionchus fissidentatus]|uniref:Uncharacterized protein n=1 Tax=Pristionchus fissidentatus TaxID=1538716 RepID=A0AAV5W477_9BILA|nr:hypothetical protein PFISCL1PPCAC_17888 [Pristionchus fissidentatus]